MNRKVITALSTVTYLSKASRASLKLVKSPPVPTVYSISSVKNRTTSQSPQSLGWVGGGLPWLLSVLDIN